MKAAVRIEEDTHRDSVQVAKQRSTEKTSQLVHVDADATTISCDEMLTDDGEKTQRCSLNFSQELCLRSGQAKRELEQPSVEQREQSHSSCHVRKPRLDGQSPFQISLATCQGRWQHSSLGFLVVLDQTVTFDSNSGKRFKLEQSAAGSVTMSGWRPRHEDSTDEKIVWEKHGNTCSWERAAFFVDRCMICLEEHCSGRVKPHGRGPQACGPWPVCSHCVIKLRTPGLKCPVCKKGLGSVRRAFSDLSLKA